MFLEDNAMVFKILSIVSGIIAIIIACIEIVKIWKYDPKKFQLLMVVDQKIKKLDYAILSFLILSLILFIIGVAL